MNITTQNVAAELQVRRTRSLTDLLAPVEELASHSASLLSKPLAPFQVDGDDYQIPRYLFIGPRGGDDPIRLGIFAAIHGDEPEGANALVQLLHVLEERPELARDFFLFVYPVCNPTGYEDRTRFSRAGFDLNREFWNNSHQPEVRIFRQTAD
jgi:predicted deacylase